MQINSNETVIAKAQKHWMFFSGPIFAIGFVVYVIGSSKSDDGAAFWGLCFLCSVGWLLYRVARYFCDEIVLTNQKLHSSIGVISRDAMSMPLNRINNIGFSQSIFGRLTGYGTIDFRSIGGTRYSYISNPELFKADIEQAVEAVNSKN